MKYKKYENSIWIGVMIILLVFSIISSSTIHSQTIKLRGWRQTSINMKKIIRHQDDDDNNNNNTHTA